MEKTVSLQGLNVQRQSYTILRYLPIWNRRNAGMDDFGSAPCKSPTRNHIRHSTSTLTTWNPQLPEHAISSHSSVAPLVYLDPKSRSSKTSGQFPSKICTTSLQQFLWLFLLNHGLGDNSHFISTTLAAKQKIILIMCIVTYSEGQYASRLDLSGNGPLVQSLCKKRHHISSTNLSIWIYTITFWRHANRPKSQNTLQITRQSKTTKIAPKLIYEFTACKSPSQISIQVAALMAFCCASWFLKVTNAHDVVDLRSAGGITHALERWQGERGGDFDVDKWIRGVKWATEEKWNFLHYLLLPGSIGIPMMEYNFNNPYSIKGL